MIRLIKVPSYSGDSESWVKFDGFCPSCGEASVWGQTEGEGDYDAGERHICASCDVYFYMHKFEPIVEADELSSSQLKAIKDIESE